MGFNKYSERTKEMNVYSKINSLLTPSERRSAGLLSALMFLGMLLEMVGIGIVIPVISLMLQDDLLNKYPNVATVVSIYGRPTQNDLIVAAMVGLVAVFAIKNVFMAFLIWKQTQFAYDAQATLSRRLFEIYLRQPYTFHLQRNSAQLVGNVTSEVGIFSGVLTNTLVLFTELMVLVGVALLLLFVEPMGLLIVALVIGGAAWGFHYLTRDYIARWGKERLHHSDMRIQHVQQGLGGAKDVKLLGREQEFLDQFHLHNVKSARAWKFQYTFQGMPRLLFEILAVSGLVVLVLAMLGQNRGMNSIVPALGLFAAAAFRIMPSVNRVLNSFQSLRFNMPVVDTLYEETQINISEPMLKQIPVMGEFKSNISLVDIIYYYPDAEIPSLNGVSIEIKRGESVGFIGASGSGKSTLVDVILGLLPPSSGFVEVDGQNIEQLLRQWQDRIGYVPQSIYLTDDTLRRNVAFGLPDDEIDESGVNIAINLAQLEEFVSTLPAGVDTMVGERGVRLSGGQRQRIGIARALYHDPAILVLDEATSALDSLTEAEVMEAVMALHGSKTILIVAHRLSTVKGCDRLFRLEQGKVVEVGTAEEMLF